MLSTLLMIALQTGANDYQCSPPGSVRTCWATDGSSYIERVVGNRVIRQATDANGESWTEYVITEAGGTRLIGQDASGRSWTQTCSPTSGTRGTGRSGESVYTPPRHLTHGAGISDVTTASSYAPCSDTVDAFDTNGDAVRALTAREIELRDRRRRQRRRGL